MNRMPVIYSAAGGISAIAGWLLFWLLPVTQMLGPGIILGISIILVRWILEKEPLHVGRVLAAIILCTLGWVIAAKLGAFLYDLIDPKPGSSLAIAFSGAVSGFVGVFFVLLSVNVLFYGDPVHRFSLPALITGGLIGCIVLPFVVVQNSLYIFLFLPWQAAVLFVTVFDEER